MQKILTNFRTHRLAKYLISAIFLFLFYVIYNLYIWSKTQSTDNAYLEAEISSVSSEINGVVKNVFISDNKYVKCGDIIAEIHDADFKANLIKAEATINGSGKDINVIEQKILIEQINGNKNKELLELKKTNLDIISSDYSRTVELHKDNFASQKLLDTAKNTLENAKSEYAQAKLSLQINEQTLLSLYMQKSSAEANLEALKQAKNLAERSLYNTKIRAPIDGKLANSSLRIGNFIRPGIILFSIVPSDKLYIKANFKEGQIAKFKEGMRVLIKFDAINKLKIYGKIRNISPATGSKFGLLPPDNATGNFTKIVQRIPVLIDFELPKNVNLVTGMSSSVSILIDQE